MSRGTLCKLISIQGLFFLIVGITGCQPKLLGSLAALVGTSLLPVSITTPASNGSYINIANQSSVPVAGTCSPDGTNVVLAGPTPVSATLVCAAGVWSTSLDFSGVSDGAPINLTAAVSTSDGTTLSVLRTFIKDTVAPVVAFTGSVAGPSTVTGLIFTGTCEASGTVNLTGDLSSPSTTPCDSGGAFSQFITFTAGIGIKSITISQTDAAGNVSSPVTRNFTEVAPAPCVSNLTGANGTDDNLSLSSVTALTGDTVLALGNNTAAGKESGEPHHAGNIGGPSIWWNWTAPRAGLYEISVPLDARDLGSTFDPTRALLAVYGLHGSLFKVSPAGGSSRYSKFSIRPHLELQAAYPNLDPVGSASPDSTYAADYSGSSQFDATPYGGASFLSAGYSRVTINALSGSNYYIVIDSYNDGVNTPQIGPVDLSIQPAYGDTCGPASAPTVSLNHPDAAITSPTGVTTQVVPLYAELSVASISTVTVPYTVTGTAISGIDYTVISSGTLTFQPGETLKNLSPFVQPATPGTAARTIIVTLGSPTGATLGAQSQTTFTLGAVAGGPNVISSVPSYDFGNVYPPVNNASGPVFTITFTNTGNGDATNFNYNLNGQGNSYYNGITDDSSGLGSCNLTSTLIPGQSCTVTIQLIINYFASFTNGSVDITYDGGGFLSIPITADDLSVVPPSNLTYSPSTFTLTTGTAMTPITPTYSGDQVSNFSITPSLSAGLSFDTIIGTISGTPTATHAQTTYAISATNSAGSTNVNVIITVTNAVAPQLASVKILNITPTNSRTFSLQYGAVTGTYSSYCILENDTTVGDCSWLAGSLPSTYAVTSAPGAIVLSIWIRKTPTLVSSGVDSQGSGCGTIVSAPNMTALRSDHRVTNLSNGKVLITGGFNGASTLSSAEVYDPTSGTTGSFTAVGSMMNARMRHTATLLANGNVLVAGGDSGSGILKQADIYDPSGQSFSSTGPLQTTRESAVAVLLADGRVLIAGGSNGTGTLSSAEIYDPAGRTFSATGSMASQRKGSSAVLLADGTVLIAGGVNNAGTTLSTLEVFNPGTGLFSSAGSMSAPRANFPMVKLVDGRILMADASGGGSEASRSTVSASPSSVPADGSTTSTITVTVKDAFSSPISGKTVTLTSSNGASDTITAVSGTTSNASGVVTFTVKSATVETSTFTAKDTSNIVTIIQTASVTFLSSGSSASNSTVSASPSSVPADGSTASTITVTLKDASSNPVSGATVTLTSSNPTHDTITAVSGTTSNASGVVTFTVKSSTAETSTFTAADTTHSVTISSTASVTFQLVASATRSSVSAYPTSVFANGEQSTFTIMLSDSNLLPVSGKTVTLTSNNGSNDTITTLSNVSDSLGFVTFKVSSLIPETSIFTARDSTDGVTLSQMIAIIFKPLTEATNSTVSASPTTVVADGTTASTITVTLKHPDFTPFPGQTVTLVSSNPPNDTITAVSGTTSNASGVVTFTVSSLIQEVSTFTATDTSSSVTIDQTAAVTFGPVLGSPDSSTVIAIPASVPADGAATSIITVTVKDSNAVALQGKTVTLASSRGSLIDTIAPSSATSNASGIVTFTVKSSSMGTAILTATDTMAGTITQTASVLFYNHSDLYTSGLGLSTTAPLNTERSLSTGALLPDGAALIVGGLSADATPVPIANTEIYNPTTGTFSPGPALITARYSAPAVSLNNGWVLIAGGCGTSSLCTPLATAELYKSAASCAEVLDTTAPTVSIGTPSMAAVPDGGSVSFTVNYSDSNPGDVTLSSADITLNSTGTAAATISAFRVDNQTGFVTLSGVSGAGTLGISLGANTATDAAGNLAPAAGPSSLVTAGCNPSALPFGAGDGSSVNPYQICSVAQLQNVTNNINSNFVQMADLDLTAVSFSPIGFAYGFYGGFDGNGYRISNWTYSANGAGYNWGFFSSLKTGAVVQNVALVNVNLSQTGTGWYVGALVGYNQGTVLNSYSTGSVSGYQSVGGLVGDNGASTGTNVFGLVSGSYSTASVSGTNVVGGLVGGDIFGIITESFATGSVTGTGQDAGGLVGFTETDLVQNCYATGSVTGNDSVGGLVGFNYATTIMNTYSIGSVSGNTNVGGLEGFLQGFVLGAPTTSSYWNIQTSGQAHSAEEMGPITQGSGTGEVGETTAQMETQANYPNSWDFTNIWLWNPGSYPTLRTHVTSNGIAITSPAGNSYINSANKAEFTLSGVCSPGGGVITLTANSHNLGTTNCNSGYWSKSVDLSVAANFPDNPVFPIVATLTGVGLPAGDTRYFSKDTVAPALTYNSNGPVPGSAADAQNHVTISGACEANLMITVTGDISGGSMTFTCGAGGTYSQQITVTSSVGVKNITISQTDPEGNTTTQSVGVVVPAASCIALNDSSDLTYNGSSVFANRTLLVTGGQNPAKVVINADNSGAPKTDPMDPAYVSNYVNVNGVSVPNPGGSLIWWKWVAPFTGGVQITIPDGQRYLLGVYTLSGNSLVHVADDFSSYSHYGNLTAYGGVAGSFLNTNPTQVTFNAVQGTEYEIAADGFNDTVNPPTQGAFRLSISPSYGTTYGSVCGDSTRPVVELDRFDELIDRPLGSGSATTAYLFAKLVQQADSFTTEPASTTVTVPYTVTGTAVEGPSEGNGEFYFPVSLSGTLTFAPGEVVKNLTPILFYIAPPFGQTDIVITLGTPSGEAQLGTGSQTTRIMTIGRECDVNDVTNFSGGLYNNVGSGTIIQNGTSGAISGAVVVNGNVNDPYLICTDLQLDNVRNHVNGSFDFISTDNFKLVSNIDISVHFPEWTPIGTIAHPFTATMDGAGLHIQNLQISSPPADNVGLFGVASGVINSLTIDGASINAPGFSSVGALVGWMKAGGTITNCVVDASGSSTNTILGNAAVGGVVGTLNTNMDTSSNGNNSLSNSGIDISAVTGPVGGLAGMVEGDTAAFFAVNISDCFSLGNVTQQAGGNKDAGGLIGTAHLANVTGATPAACYATGNVTATPSGNFFGYGGLIGSFMGDTDFSTAFTQTNLNNCQASGNVSVTDNSGVWHGQAGGLVGYVQYGIVNQVSATGTVSGVGGAADVGGLIGYLFGVARTGAASPDPADPYSKLSNATASGNVTFNYASASGRAEVGGLVGFQNDADITTSSATGSVVVQGQTTDAGGLVGYLLEGTISSSHHWGTVDSTQVASDLGESGGLVGFVDYSSGNTLDPSQITNSFASGNVLGTVYAGGLVGIMDQGKIASSYFSGAVMTSRLDGSNRGAAGGIVGILENDNNGATPFATVIDSFAAGTVAGIKNVAGLAGWDALASATSIARSYTLEQIIQTGALGSNNFGPIAGNSDNAVSSNSCYFDSDLAAIFTNGNSNANGGNAGPGANGLTSVTMADQANAATNFAGFDFSVTPTWSTGSGTFPYPVPVGLPVPLNYQLGFSVSGGVPPASGTCVQVNVNLLLADGITAGTAGADTTITLSATGSGLFYNENTCTTAPVSSATILANQNSTAAGGLWIQDVTPESVTITGTGSSTAITLIGDAVMGLTFQ